LLGFSFIFTVITFFIGNDFFYYGWLLTFLTCIMTLILAVPKRFYNLQTLKALTSLPYGFLMMALAVIRMKLGSKRLSPTPHNTSSEAIKKNN